MNNTALLQQLKSPDPELKQQAILKIGNSFDTELLIPLAELAIPDPPELALLLIKDLQNLPLEKGISYLLPMSRSPNETTKNSLYTTLDQIDYEQDPEIINKILTFDDEPLVLFVLKKLKQTKRQILLSIIAPLLSSSSGNIAKAAFKLIAGWNFPSSIPILLPFLKTQKGLQKILAISTLGRLTAFLKWKKLRPFINSKEPEVRQVVVQSIRLCGGTSPKAFFLKALKQETDGKVIKELITALRGAHSSSVISEFIRLAALHKEPSVRKTANWAVNECPEKILKKNIKKMLNPKNEILCRFLITKIGELQIIKCGNLVVSFLKPKAPAPLKYAALESLCLLKNKKYLKRLKPFIKSSDSMEAYLGSLAAANTISSLDECSELKEIFLSSDPKHDVQKQTLLELMNGPIKWDPADETILAALKANLNSPNTNMRYLSLFLIKKTKNTSFIPLLTQKAIDDPDQVIRDTVVQCIDALLKGDLGYYLETLTSQQEPEQINKLLTLILKLNWDKKNALTAIIFFTKERWQKTDLLIQLAAKLYPVCPREIEGFVRQNKTNTFWLLALSSAWLANINPLNTEANKEHWQTLLNKGIPGLQALLVQKAINNKSKWAVEPLQHSLDNITDPAIVGLTKRAVKKIIEL